jgi:hypothetical protein
MSAKPDEAHKLQHAIPSQWETQSQVLFPSILENPERVLFYDVFVD